MIRAFFGPKESRQFDEHMGNKMLTRAITADPPSVWDLVKSSFQVVWTFSELISPFIYQRLVVLEICVLLAQVNATASVSYCVV